MILEINCPMCGNNDNVIIYGEDVVCTNTECYDFLKKDYFKIGKIVVNEKKKD